MLRLSIISYSNLCPRAEGDGHFAMLGLGAVNFDKVVEFEFVFFQKAVVDLDGTHADLKFGERRVIEADVAFALFKGHCGTDGTRADH